MVQEDILRDPHVQNVRRAIGLRHAYAVVQAGADQLEIFSLPPDIKYLAIITPQEPGEPRLPIIAVPQESGHPVQPVPRNKRWVRNSMTSRMYVAMVEAYPGWLSFQTLANISPGGVSRRMREIRVWLQTEGWDYWNENYWYRGQRRSWYRVYDQNNDYMVPVPEPEENQDEALDDWPAL